MTIPPRRSYWGVYRGAIHGFAMANDNKMDGSGSVALGSTCPSLVQRLKARQPEAWRQMADLYGPLVYYWCRRYELQPQDAADVFQEVFSAVFRGISEFQHDPARGRFRGWLWTITRNKIQDHFRNRDHRQPAEGGTEGLRRIADLPEQLPDPPSDPDESKECNSLVHRALQAVQAEFEPRTWDAFWRVVVAREETAEVAASLGMSPNAVRLAKSRVLRRARNLLADWPK